MTFSLTDIYHKLKKALDSRRGVVVVIAILAVVALFTRFYKLDTIPAPWHIDEAGMAYDAYSLAYWRVERHMMHLPVYLPNYGDGQSALYAYLTAVFIRIFNDITPFVARLPAALYSVAAIIFAALFIKETYKSNHWALLMGFLVTIFPYFIMQGRYGLDCNLFLATSIVASYFTLMAVSRKRLLLFGIAGIAWAMTLYAYALSWIIVPLFLVMFFVYLLYVKRVSLLQILFFGLPLFAFALPLIVFCIIEVFDMMPVFSRFYYIPRLMNNRIDTFVFFNWANFLKLPRLLFWVQDGEAYLFYPTFYWISVPFALVGMYVSARDCIQKLRQKELSGHAIPVLFFLANLLSIAIQSHNSNDTHHINSIFWPMAFFVFVGVVFVYRYMKKIRNARQAALFLVALITWYVVAAVYFLYQYFIIFPQTPTYTKTFMYSPTTEQVMDKLDEYAKEHHIEEVIAERQVWLDIPRYVFYYLGEKTPTPEMDLTKDILNEVRFGNVHFTYLPDRGAEYCAGLPWCPTEINEQDIFIISNNDPAYQERLRSLGLEPIYQDDAFVILLKPEHFMAGSELQE